MSMPAAPPTAAAVCGVPRTGGPLSPLPQAVMRLMPLNDLGRHELILHVTSQKDRYCFRYVLNGVEENVAPVIHVQRGETFALRIVNDLHGPASGATMSASALPPCGPSPMQMSPKLYALPGYLGHTQYYEPLSRAARPDDVNIHLHGFQGPAAQENVFYSTLSTPAKACEYTITIPQNQPVGTYFYHPHVHEMSDDEVAGGLSGMWIVDADSAELPPSDEHQIVLQYQIPFNSDDAAYMPPSDLFELVAYHHLRSARPVAAVAYDPFHPPAWPASFPVHVAGYTMPACGVFPETLVAVNGAAGTPALAVPPGQPQLLRIMNATSDSFESLHLRDAAGGHVVMNVVERDGVPVSGDSSHPLSRYIPMHDLLLSPTNRADVLVTLKPGQTVTLAAGRTCLGPISEYQLPHDLMTITAGAPAADPVAIASTGLEQKQSPAQQLLSYAAAHHATIRRRAFTYTEYAVPNVGKRGFHGQFYIAETDDRNFQERPFSPVYAQGANVPQPDVIVKHGSIEEWYLFNATLEPHTFHIHQMAFVAEDELPQPVMLDTVIVRVGKMLPNPADPDYPLIKPGLTRVLLDFRNVPRGTFVFHCHMLFHEDHGMMRIIKVV